MLLFCLIEKLSNYTTFLTLPKMTAYTRNFFKKDYTKNKNRFREILSNELKNSNGIQEVKKPLVQFEPQKKTKNRFSFTKLVEKRMGILFDFLANFVENVLNEEDIA